MGRPKGSKNRPKDERETDRRFLDDGSDFDADEEREATSGELDTPAEAGDSSEQYSARGRFPTLKDLDRIEEFEPLMRKYARAAKYLGMNYLEIDRRAGDPSEMFSRRLRYRSSSVPLPPAAIAIYQRIIPLSADYLRSEDVEDFPEDKMLETGSTASSWATQPQTVRRLAKVLEDRGIVGEDATARTIEFVITLGFLQMSPQDVFDAAMEVKIRKEAERMKRELAKSLAE